MLQETLKLLPLIGAQYAANRVLQVLLFLFELYERPAADLAKARAVLVKYLLYLILLPRVEM